MKTATMSARPTHTADGFAWSWRCAADDTASTRTFAYFYECLTDAREHGYDVEPVHASGIMAPGGPQYDLHRMHD
jgi:hypothetical protein